MYGMFTFNAVIGLIPAIMRARILGKEVFDLIERDPEIRSPHENAIQDVNI